MYISCSLNRYWITVSAQKISKSVPVLSLTALTVLDIFTSVVEPEPQGAETFGRNRSWSRYIKFRLRLPGLVQTKLVHKNHTSYWIGSRKWIKSILFPKKHEKSTFNIKAVQTGGYKAEVRVGSETFWKSEPEHIVSAPQHWTIYFVPGISSEI
jgi:hypothetical protein